MVLRLEVTYGLKDNNVEYATAGKFALNVFLTIRNIHYIFFSFEKNHSTRNNVNFFVYDFFSNSVRLWREVTYGLNIGLSL